MLTLDIVQTFLEANKYNVFRMRGPADISGGDIFVAFSRKFEAINDAAMLEELLEDIKKYNTTFIGLYKLEYFNQMEEPGLFAIIRYGVPN